MVIVVEKWLLLIQNVIETNHFSISFFSIHLRAKSAISWRKLSQESTHWYRIIFYASFPGLLDNWDQLKFWDCWICSRLKFVAMTNFLYIFPVFRCRWKQRSHGFVICSEGMMHLSCSWSFWSKFLRSTLTKMMSDMLFDAWHLQMQYKKIPFQPWGIISKFFCCFIGLPKFPLC